MQKSPDRIPPAGSNEERQEKVGPPEIKFTVPGRPEFLRRHRTRVAGKKAIQYDPPENKRAKRAIQTQAFAVVQAVDVPFEKGPVGVGITAYFEVPKSRRRKRAPVPEQLHTKKPDLDNIVKIYCDAMTGVVWTDDTQVAFVQAIKMQAAQGEPPRTEVRVFELKGLNHGA
jgi:Holliday junction resolvase RusA-like endonuclease